LRDLCVNLLVVDFPDHHSYRVKDLQLVVKTYEEVFTHNKIIITTEKDTMRLIKSEYISRLDKLPIIFYSD